MMYIILNDRKPPVDCRNAQSKMSAKLTRLPQQEHRGVVKFRKMCARRTPPAHQRIVRKDNGSKSSTADHAGICDKK